MFARRGWPFGQVFLAPFDVVFTRFDVVEPDLLYLSTARAAAILTDANVQGARGFARPIELRKDEGDVLTTPLLPGLELPLARVFRD